MAWQRVILLPGAQSEVSFKGSGQGFHGASDELGQYGTAADRAALETEANVSIISTPQSFNEEELYVDLEPTFGRPLFRKSEGFNFAGSIKLKAATEMVEAAEREGVLMPGRNWSSPPPAI